MERKAVALLSGGLDSRLAIRVIQEQGIEVEALNFRTMFSCCKDDASGAARELGVKLTFVSQGDDYLDLIKNPKYGHGHGMNPCVDCRIYMYRLGAALMEKVGASFVISGEVLGQRPMSQMLKQLLTIARDSGLEGRLLRPLSARFLPPTLPEKEGIVDRAKLLDIQGRSRKRLHELARYYGLSYDSSASTGCALTDEGFANKVKDLVAHKPDAGRWDFELLKAGRHLRLDDHARVILGREEADNLLIERYFQEAPEDEATLVRPKDFGGPVAIIAGDFSRERVLTTGGLIVRYTGKKAPENPVVEYVGPHEVGEMSIPGPLEDEIIDGMKISLHGGEHNYTIKKKAVIHG